MKNINKICDMVSMTCSCMGKVAYEKNSHRQQDDLQASRDGLASDDRILRSPGPECANQQSIDGCSLTNASERFSKHVKSEQRIGFWCVLQSAENNEQELKL